MANKGAPFEREVCRKLSLWFSGGKYDDWFWRASQSGGRATQRAKTGRRTIGHYGDVAATCPQGNRLMRFMTPELKRGYGFKKRGKTKPRSVFSTLYDLLDRSLKSEVKNVIDDFIEQAKKAHKLAGSKYWCVIHQRDRREAVIFGPRKMFDDLNIDSRLNNFPYIKVRAASQFTTAIRFCDFLKYADRKAIRKKVR